MPADLRNLYRHLVERGRIKQLDNFDDKRAAHLLARRPAENQGRGSSWEDMVPAEIAEVIKRRRFFGYRDAEVPEGALAR